MFWSILGVIGCSGSLKRIEHEALLPEIDVVHVKENSDEALRLAQEAKLDVEVINTKLMETDNRIIVLSEEVSSISAAKIEELENRLTLLIEAYKDLHARTDALEVQPVRTITRSSNPKPRTDATFSTSSASELLQTSVEYDLYQKALRIFNERNYKQARVLFFDVLKQYPTGEYADDATYWIGESFYLQGDFASAVAHFQKVHTFNDSPKSDDAQLKVALSYLKLGHTEKAKNELKKLISRYPASEYIPRAKGYLAKMGG